MTKSSLAIGIDLGTTYSCVGVFLDGSVQIIANSQGKRTTPSYVAFNEHERLIGEAAFDQFSINPQNTVFDAKRLIGRRFQDEIVQRDIKLWPFEVIDDEGKPKIRIEHIGKKKDLHAEEISSMVLYRMKETAESYLGQKVTKAVVTVPAYFTDAQRQATKDAGAIAGLNVMKIINEPTAAAIAYGLIRIERERNVLIFDFGGGTLDVSVLKIKDKKIVVRSTGGDTHLGGEDIDNILVAYFVDEFKRKHKKDISKDKKSLGKLRRSVENAKRTLSGSNMATVNVDSLFEGTDFSSSISIARFNELCDDLVQSTLTHVIKALNDANLDKKEIDDVLLVGGSSRIPKVQELLQDFFDGRELNKSINMDEAVAYGAAIQAAIENKECDRKLKGLTLKDITPMSLGVIEHDGSANVIIKRNSQVPITKVVKGGLAQDNQTTALFRIFEGEEPKGEQNNILGKLILNRITPPVKGKVKFEIKFSIDVNGILTVSIVDKSIGVRNDIQIKNEGSRLTPEQIIQSIKDAKEFKAQDDKQKERMDTLIRFENYTNNSKKLMMNPQMNTKVHEVHREIVIQACDEASHWIEQNKGAEKEVIEKREEELRRICQPIISLTPKS